MTREDIIAMAREAGLEDEVLVPWAYEINMFAALVAAAERERIITANAPEIEKVNAHIKALEDAVAAEREAWQKEREQLMIQIGVLRSQILGIRMEFGEGTTVSNLSAALQAEDAVNAAAIRARSAK